MGLFGTTAFYDHVTSTQVWTCFRGYGLWRGGRESLGHWGGGGQMQLMAAIGCSRGAGRGWSPRGPADGAVWDDSILQPRHQHTGALISLVE